MTISNTSTCPTCGGETKRYDKVRRIVRSKGGSERWIYIPRFRCIDCNHIHRELPNFIFPYKHYEAGIINGVLDGTITPDTLDFEDYPCEVTMKRWARE